MKIAIFGLGTVGYGVYDILQNKTLGIEVSKVFNKNKTLNKPNLYANTIEEIMEDSKIDAIVETLGGDSLAYEVIKKALLSRKNVVTANKEVIAKHLSELTKLKTKMGVSLYYEASVGGGIPLIKTLYRIKTTNKIASIEGILNGTTNYILSKMNEGLSFKESLKLAQELGFAEQDPTNDIIGLDAMRKIAILAMIAFNKKIALQSIYTYGIKDLHLDDLVFLKKHHYVLKMLAFVSKKEIGVEPVAFLTNSLFANVNNEYNAVEITTNLYEKLIFYGKGAGRYPTACAVVDDLISIKEKEKNYSYQEGGVINFSNQAHTYYLRVKNSALFNPEIIYYQEQNQIITKPILLQNLDFTNIYFYARIRNEDNNV